MSKVTILDKPIVRSSRHLTSIMPGTYFLGSIRVSGPASDIGRGFKLANSVFYRMLTGVTVLEAGADAGRFWPESGYDWVIDDYEEVDVNILVTKK